MKLHTEIGGGEQRILIVSPKPSPITEKIKNQLAKYDCRIFVSPLFGNGNNRFDYVFVVNGKVKKENIERLNATSIIIVISNKPKNASFLKNLAISYPGKKIKIVTIDSGHDLSPQNIESLLWFSFSHSDEKFLQLRAAPIRDKAKPHPATHRRIDAAKAIFNLLSTKNILLFAAIVVFFLHIAFIPFLGLSFWHLYKGGLSLRQRNGDIMSTHVAKSRFWLNISRRLYHLPRQTYLLFSIARIPDDLLLIDDKGCQTLEEAGNLLDDSPSMISLFMKKDKTKDEKNQLVRQISVTKNRINRLTDNLSLIADKLPDNITPVTKLKGKINSLVASINRSKVFFPYTDYLLASGTEKKYLLLFANNMELRPGGGFIGSYGILTISDYTLKDIRIYDVYDADGRLTAHIDPPLAISKYLGQPHWFLRDSAFSGDFLENYNYARFFLDREIGETGFSGGAIITTPVIRNILAAFGQIKLDDFNETVTPDNFYIKAQMYSEKGFFPGSTQKKSFLSSLTRYILVNMDMASPPLLFQNLLQSLDEKQMAMYFDQADLQRIVNHHFWSGQMIDPACPPNLENCLTDYIYPLDANLGVNKANLYISRVTGVTVKIDRSGRIRTNIRIKIKNDSPNDVFPGGPYKNYFQIFLPGDAILKKLIVNDTQVDGYDEITENLKKLGFLVEINPGQAKEIQIEYTHSQSLRTGKGYYQLVIQKQMGTPNSDLDLVYQLPGNIHSINQNFAPLVKDGQMIYNTQLSTDKIFFVELVREN